MKHGFHPRRRQLARRLAETHRGKRKDRLEGLGTVYLGLLIPVLTLSAYVSNRNLVSARWYMGRHTRRFTVTTINDMMIVASSRIEN